MNKQDIMKKYLRGVITFEEAVTYFNLLGLTETDFQNELDIIWDIQQQADLPPVGMD